MTGQLYHSGGVPVHALTIEISGVGHEEAVSALDLAAWLPMDETKVLVTARSDMDHGYDDGFLIRIETAPTEAQAIEMVRSLYAARTARASGGKQPVAEPEAAQEAYRRHPRPGEVLTEEPPVGSTIRDKYGYEHTRSAGGWVIARDKDGSSYGTDNDPWDFQKISKYGPLALVRWGGAA